MRAPRRSGRAAGWRSCRDLRVETGDRVAGVDEVALVDEPLGQYPVVGGGDIDLLAAAADAAERGAGGQPGALGDLGRADRAAGGGDDDPPVGQVLGLGAAALGGDQLAGAVEVGGAGQGQDLDVRRPSTRAWPARPARRPAAAR